MTFDFTRQAFFELGKNIVFQLLELFSHNITYILSLKHSMFNII